MKVYYLCGAVYKGVYKILHVAPVTRSHWDPTPGIQLGSNLALILPWDVAQSPAKMCVTTYGYLQTEANWMSAKLAVAVLPAVYILLI